MPFNEDARLLDRKDPDEELYEELIELPGTTGLLPGMLEFLEEEKNTPNGQKKGPKA